MPAVGVEEPEPVAAPGVSIVPGSAVSGTPSCARTAASSSTEARSRAPKAIRSVRRSPAARIRMMNGSGLPTAPRKARSGVWTTGYSPQMPR